MSTVDRAVDRTLIESNLLSVGRPGGRPLLATCLVGKIKDRGVNSLFDCKENYSGSIILLQERGEIFKLKSPLCLKPVLDVAKESESYFLLTE